ncbi:hypothetical protein FB381_0236 [Nocardioides albertanoniae]|uniref:Uncharacterized protein n=1 Tax=Nocardioides albertanoniae TaxID=1175486 RepID=A0A543A1C7_9ACTN|nr:hypothetical protein [Nocardioides albertanoniae]TQL66382.1 hypothetical protein FB381_0236 [Nocardioides albertanoniae]
MISKIRIAGLAILTLTGLYVGGWATFAPRSFYDAFPGFHRIWVGVDGPFNEHLVRDVGGLYLALGVAGVLVLVWRTYPVSAVVAAAWATFSIPHFWYHVNHLHVYGTFDKVANVVALGGTLLIALALLIPPRHHRDTAAR